MWLHQFHHSQHIAFFFKWISFSSWSCSGPENPRDVQSDTWCDLRWNLRWWRTRPERLARSATPIVSLNHKKNTRLCMRFSWSLGYHWYHYAITEILNPECSSACAKAKLIASFDLNVTSSRAGQPGPAVVSNCLWVSQKSERLRSQIRNGEDRSWGTKSIQSANKSLEEIPKCTQTLKLPSVQKREALKIWMQKGQGLRFLCARVYITRDIC